MQESVDYPRSQLGTVERLVRLRTTLGFTQREMAAEFNVTKSAIAYWEMGQRDIPGPVLKLIELYEAELHLHAPVRATAEDVHAQKRVDYLDRLNAIFTHGREYDIRIRAREAR